MSARQNEIYGQNRFDKTSLQLGQSHRVNGLPRHLSTRQTLDVAACIHRKALAVIQPLALESSHYQGMWLVVEQMGEAVTQMQEVVKRRRARKMNRKGKLRFEETINEKYAVYIKRQKLLKRMRRVVDLYAIKDENSVPVIKAANLLKSHLSNRRERFEYLSYAEASVEFMLFFDLLDCDPKRMDALVKLNLKETYYAIKEADQAFDEAHLRFAQANLQRQTLPYLRGVERQVRRMVRIFMATVQHEVLSGNQALLSLDLWLDEVLAGLLTQGTGFKESQDVAFAASVSEVERAKHDTGLSGGHIGGVSNCEEEPNEEEPALESVDEIAQVLEGIDLGKLRSEKSPGELSPDDSSALETDEMPEAIEVLVGEVG